MTNPARAAAASNRQARPSSLLRGILKRFGKGGEKVAVVFGFSPAATQQAVLHIREGAPDIPIWLFSVAEPLPETAAACQRIVVRRNAFNLLLRAEVELWPRWVAISAGCWTGGRGHWLVKAGPLLVPPFRAVLANGHGDFLPGTAANILLHCRRRMADAMHSMGTRARELAAAYWLLISYHIWRTGPCNRARDLWRLVTYHIWRAGPCTRIRDVVAAAALLVWATVLGWFGYPDRRVFKRLVGGEPLPVALPSSSESGIAQDNRAATAWNPVEFEAFATSSSARWIVWSLENAACPIDDMLPLLEDERTFAVSRQSHFRGWRAMLFATAPFRVLQAGEASRVLAPLSGTIVVDRRKLLALGIPRCGLSWTAWMLLFWKAAAADWRSYTIGSGGELREEPERPREERAFILRVLLDPALKCLGPREPDLSRGNIAFRPGATALRGGGTRPKVLVVSPFLPYPLSHGGAVRIFNLCRALSGRVDFGLVAIREKGEAVPYEKLHDVFREVRIVDIDEVELPDERLPQQVRQHRSRGLRAAIAGLCSSWQPDLLQVEFTHMAEYRDAAPGLPAILVEHDLTFSLYRQIAEAGPTEEAHQEYQRWLEFERHWLGAYDSVWTVSESDRKQAISEGSHSERTFAIPNGVDTSRFVPAEDPAPALEVLYVGSFRHLPNVMGFEQLRAEIMPRVWRTHPNLTLRVVAGAEHSWFWNRFSNRGRPLDSDRRIQVHGFVEDLRPLYAQAGVAAVPLHVSAGTNIKVLEAMACGKAVVTTPVGCSGLGLQDDYDALIRADWSEFSETVCDVLSDRGLRSRIGGQARRTVEDRFGWDTIQDQAYRSYLQLIGRGTGASLPAA